MLAQSGMTNEVTSTPPNKTQLLECQRNRIKEIFMHVLGSTLAMAEERLCAAIEDCDFKMAETLQDIKTLVPALESDVNFLSGAASMADLFAIAELCLQTWKEKLPCDPVVVCEFSTLMDDGSKVLQTQLFEHQLSVDVMVRARENARKHRRMNAAV